MKAELTFTTELDQNECPDSYCLTGTVVVAWQGNTRLHADKAGYIKTLRSYAKN